MAQVFSDFKLLLVMLDVSNVTTATAGSGDYSSLSTPLTFANGSADGSMMCASVTANDDDLVEPEERFTVELDLLTPAGTSLSLGNTETTVTFRDSDSMLLTNHDALTLIFHCFFQWLSLQYPPW